MKRKSSKEHSVVFLVEGETFKVSWYPKIDHVFENTLLSFSDRYYSNLSFTKSCRKKLFLRKVMDEKRFVALIFSNHVLTVICQQR